MKLPKNYILFWACLPYAAAAPVCARLSGRLNRGTALLVTAAAAEACTAAFGLCI